MDADRFVEKLFASLGQWFATTQPLTTRATETHSVSATASQTRTATEEVCDVA